MSLEKLEPGDALSAKAADQSACEASDAAQMDGERSRDTKNPPLVRVIEAARERPFMQDPKYQPTAAGFLNRQSGELIPPDEPVFLFRARDVHAVKQLIGYAYDVPAGNHRRAVLKRVADFVAFQVEHPERMKEPDTDPSPPAEEVKPEEVVVLVGRSLSDIHTGFEP